MTTWSLWRISIRMSFSHSAIRCVQYKSNVTNTDLKHNLSPRLIDARRLTCIKRLRIRLCLEVVDIHLWGPPWLIEDRWNFDCLILHICFTTRFQQSCCFSLLIAFFFFNSILTYTNQLARYHLSGYGVMNHQDLQ